MRFEARSHHVIVTVVNLLIMLSVGCETEEPSAPSTRASIVGQVDVIGLLADPFGQPTGERRLTTVDSILVVMLNSDQVLQRTRTLRGHFRFDEVDVGEYELIVGEHPLPTTVVPVSVSTETLVLQSPIQLRATAALVAFPNPFQCHDGTTFAMALPEGSWELAYTAYRFDGRAIGTWARLGTTGPGVIGGVRWGCWGGGPYDFGTGAYWVRVDGEHMPTAGELHYVALVFSE